MESRPDSVSADTIRSEEFHEMQNGSPKGAVPSAPRRNRTYNLVIKSHLLCQLS